MNEQNYAIDRELLHLLRCPKDGSMLAIADDSLVEQLNEKIKLGELRDGRDQKVEQLIEAGLVTESRHRLYPIRGGIPTLIADEAMEW